MSLNETSVYSGLQGLGDAWDNLKLVRDRLQDFKNLMMEKPQPGEKQVSMKGSLAKTHANLRHNYDIMIPLMKKMKNHRDKLPCLYALENEVKACFEASRLTPTSTILADEAWSLRYMYGLVKQMTYKKAPPKESRFNLLFNFSVWEQGSSTLMAATDRDMHVCRM